MVAPDLWPTFNQYLARKITFKLVVSRHPLDGVDVVLDLARPTSTIP